MYQPMKKDDIQCVIQWILTELEKQGCPEDVLLDVNLATEEILVNVASYAFTDEMGNVEVNYTISEGGDNITLLVKDNGKPYNPLAKEDPDVTMNPEDRPIGGLGIYLVKKVMDHVRYEYKDGFNILTMDKGWKKTA